MLRPACLPSLLAVLVTAPLGADIYRVGDMGSDPNCTHSNLPTALLSAALHAGADEVRLSDSVTYNNLYVHLTDWAPTNALIIAGGFADCAPASVPSGFTTVDGGSSPVFEIDTTGGNTSVVTLRRLKITGSAQRGVLVQGDSTVTLDGTWETANTGGGLEVETGALVTLSTGNSITSNMTAGAGGGIHCSGAEVHVAGNVNNNSAAQGGGIYADSDCTVVLQDADVTVNDAVDGAGIYAAGGASVQATGDASGLEISFNTASDEGGGVYATGTGTIVSLANVQVEHNHAGEAGGGLFATAGGEISMYRTVGPCRPNAPCSTLLGNDNHPAGDFFGAGGRADGGTIDIFQTRVEANVIFSSVLGSILDARDGGTLLLEGDSFWNNTARDLVTVFSGGGAEIAFVTASGNHASGSPDPSRPVNIDGPGALARLNSSIFWPNGPFRVANGGALPEADCLILSDATGLAGGSFVSVVDPMFGNAPAGDLRLRPDSPAVDYCDNFMWNPIFTDADFEARGSNLATNPNGSPGVNGGLYDLGYDELVMLFIDSFETTLAAWSFAL